MLQEPVNHSEKNGDNRAVFDLNRKGSTPKTSPKPDSQRRNKNYC